MNRVFEKKIITTDRSDGGVGGLTDYGLHPCSFCHRYIFDC